MLLSIAASSGLGATASWTQWIPADVDFLTEYDVLRALAFAGWVMVWRVWFRLRRPAWVPWVLASLVALLMLSNILAQNLFFTALSAPVSHAFHVVSLALRLALAGLMLVTVIQGIRGHGWEGWAALPAMLLAGIAEFLQELHFAHIVNIWFPFGIQITTVELANLLLVAVVACW